MARKIEVLSALKVSRLAAPGLHADGNGLYLAITGSSRSWLLRYRHAGRRRDMGLGSADVVTLAMARDLAGDARALLAQGIDPIDHRRAAQAAAAGGAVTFADAARRMIEDRSGGWSNAKHAKQWATSLERYANPILGALPVGVIKPADIAAVLRPIWTSKAETARRVRQRIEATLNWAKAMRLTTFEVNPALLRGNLADLLPKADRGEQAHHAALAVAAMPEFMRRLRRQPGMGAKAMFLLILSATRTGETLAARWHEFDLEHGTWTIPADRTKTRSMHRVPLPAPAVALLRELLEDRRGDHVFIGPHGRPLGTGALLALMRRMGADAATPHGMRSCFRDWAARHGYAAELAEHALAHRVGSRVARAYQRDDLLEQRRPMMRAWADFLTHR